MSADKLSHSIQSNEENEKLFGGSISTDSETYNFNILKDIKGNNDSYNNQKTPFHKHFAENIDDNFNIYLTYTSFKSIFSSSPNKNTFNKSQKSPLESFLKNHNVELTGLEQIKTCFKREKDEECENDSNNMESDSMVEAKSEHTLNLLQRIDKDQPRSENVLYTPKHFNCTIGPIGDDFSFLKRIFFDNAINNLIKTDNDFMRDLRGYLSRKSGETVISKEMLTNIVKDQDGSRFIQKRLETSTSSEWQWLTRNININELCIDLFGNYVIQKLIDNKECRNIIGESILKEILHLSLNTFGCRVVQKLIDNDEIAENSENNDETHICEKSYKTRNLKEKIVKSLKPHLLTLVYDSNGNHVVQRICGDKIDFSYIFEKDCLNLATHKYGCRVLQKLFEHNLNINIINILIDNSIDLAENQYGNYVLQHVMSIDASFCNQIVNKIYNCLFTYSMHKFASNVVERIIVTLNDEIKKESIIKNCEHTEKDDKIEDNMSNSSMDDSIEDIQDVKYSFILRKIIISLKPHMMMMSIDKYANYVVQRILETKYSYLIKNELIDQIVSLKQSVYAKGIIVRLNKN